VSNIRNGLLDTLAATEYPGRGLAIGRDANGSPFAAYWLTGRSVASRSRQLMPSGNHSILVRDIGGSADDPLRHYAAYESRGGLLTIGNGTHVSDIARQITTPNDLALVLTQHE
jgi:IMP cyclohydrolase